MSGDIRNVTISNCVFQDTDRGIRLKSRRGRGGVVEDIRGLLDRPVIPAVLTRDDPDHSRVLWSILVDLSWYSRILGSKPSTLPACMVVDQNELLN